MIQTNDFEIEDLGIQEQTVYDIEVDENHNFFGNDILLHNSVYYQIGNIMDDIIKKQPNKTLNEYVDIAIKFEEKVVDPVIQKSIDEFAEKFNAFNKSAIGAKREVVADKTLLIAKKKYIARVRDEEGIRYPENDPHMKKMGVDIARSAIPNWCKEKLIESLNIILDGTESELKQWISRLKSEFVKQPVNDIVLYGSVSRIDYDLNDKGIPYMCKAGIYYNRYLKRNKLEDKYIPIRANTSVKLIKLVEPNKFGTDLIAYVDDNFENEFRECIDYDEQFRKGFLDPLNNMVKVLNYDIYNDNQLVDEW